MSCLIGALRLAFVRREWDRSFGFTTGIVDRQKFSAAAELGVDIGCRTCMQLWYALWSVARNWRLFSFAAVSSLATHIFPGFLPDCAQLSFLASTFTSASNCASWRAGLIYFSCRLEPWRFVENCRTPSHVSTSSQSVSQICRLRRRLFPDLFMS